MFLIIKKRLQSSLKPDLQTEVNVEISSFTLFSITAFRFASAEV